MQLMPFCDAFAMQFNRDRFDVDIDYRVDERGRIAVITVTCKGCNIHIGEYVTAYEIEENCHDGIVLDRADRVHNNLKYECECWRRVRHRTVTVDWSNIPPIKLPRIKRKKPMKSVVKVKRKIW